MNIALLIDEEAFCPEDPQFETGPEEVLTTVEYHVAETLRELGHAVRVIPFRQDIAGPVAELSAACPDLVFNLTEHHRGDRRMDRNVAALLELLDLPYTGAGPVGLMLCRDKALCKRLLSHHHVHVPGFAVLHPGKTRVSKRLGYPLIVKPRFEDGSDGITLSSLVANERDLAERAALLHERMKQPVICEEYIAGREIYVGITGNRRLRVYPAREVRFGNGTQGPQFATSRVKMDDAYRAKWGIEFTAADLPPDLAVLAARTARRVYRVLHLRDYGRIDLRVTPEGRLVVLEANPNPDLTMGDELAEAARTAGVPYAKLIAHIVNLALRRHRIR